MYLENYRKNAEMCSKVSSGKAQTLVSEIKKIHLIINVSERSLFSSTNWKQWWLPFLVR